MRRRQVGSKPSCDATRPVLNFKARDVAKEHEVIDVIDRSGRGAG